MILHENHRRGEVRFGKYQRRELRTEPHAVLVNSSESLRQGTVGFVLQNLPRFQIAAKEQSKRKAAQYKE
jgi:hypothetical protein